MEKLRICKNNQLSGIFFSPIFVSFSEVLNFKSHILEQILPREFFFQIFVSYSDCLNFKSHIFEQILPREFFFPIFVSFSEYLNFKSHETPHQLFIIVPIKTNVSASFDFLLQTEFLSSFSSVKL